MSATARAPAHPDGFPRITGPTLRRTALCLGPIVDCELAHLPGYYPTRRYRSSTPAEAGNAGSLMTYVVVNRRSVPEA